VAKLTVARRPLTALRLTVNVAVAVPLFPSPTLTSLIESDGAASSSVIVPSPTPSPRLAFHALESLI
jgi:hypothetical protein